MSIIVQIEPEVLNINEYADLAMHFNHDQGAQVTFTGFARQHDYVEPITHLYIEHYSQITENEIKNIVEKARQRWVLSAIVVAHRVGKVVVGEPIVWVMTQSKHRIDAYQANEFIMDYLKTSAPFWKQEHFENGESHWVVAKKSDQNKIKKWSMSL